MPSAGGSDEGSGRLISPVDVFRAYLYAPMTFPMYRPLLLGDPARRLALGLTHADEPAGLGLVELEPNGDTRLRSLYVAEALRGRGLAAALLEALEAAGRAAGRAEITAVWMAGQPSTAAVERVLAKRGWEPPAPRMHVLRSNLESIDRARWMTRARLDPAFETFLWKDLTAAERAAVERRQETHPVSREVYPFNFSPAIEPHSSLGVRHQGEVVGWVVNHRYDEKTARFTCSYLRDELQGRGRLVAVYAESINRLRPIGFTDAIWTIPVEFPGMVAFMVRHLIPYATEVTETRGSRKALA